MKKHLVSGLLLATLIALGGSFAKGYYDDGIYHAWQAGYALGVDDGKAQASQRTAAQAKQEMPKWLANAVEAWCQQRIATGRTATCTLQKYVGSTPETAHLRGTHAMIVLLDEEPIYIEALSEGENVVSVR